MHAGRDGRKKEAGEEDAGLTSIRWSVLTVYFPLRSPRSSSQDLETAGDGQCVELHVNDPSVFTNATPMRFQ